jgi:hypothetical protein
MIVHNEPRGNTEKRPHRVHPGGTHDCALRLTCSTGINPAGAESLLDRFALLKKFRILDRFRARRRPLAALTGSQCVGMID